MTGVRTSFGALLVSSATGSWVLYDAANNSLVAGAGPPTQNAGAANVDAGIVLPVAGIAAVEGPSRNDNCLGNGDFGPPFYYNRAGKYLSFAVSSWFFDPNHPHCYPVDFSGNVGSAPMPRIAGGDTCQPQRAGTDATGSVRSAKYPNGLQNATTAAACCGACNSDPTCTAWVWSDGSSPDPAGDCWPLASYSGTSARSGRVLGGSGPPPPQQAWWAMGGAADWYLSPCDTPLAYYRALYELTGAPAVPPLFAMGFMATYWGYQTMEQVESNMTAARDGAFPWNSFIMDYDWFDMYEKYDDSMNYDFSYDATMFGNHTFIHAPGSLVPNATTSGPVELLDHFHKDINMSFIGIRKPRTYSNQAFSNASGWLLPDSFSVGAGPNNWNMTASGWADWWVAKTSHFTAEGVDAWWNDEGETQWFTYSWWNAAQAAAQAAVAPLKRFWSINRSFQPGMQTLAATTWTGDQQDCSHRKMLAFAIAGQLYSSCDMTSPSATVLVRQYQNAIFSPIMRVHQMHGVPRFPWLWGGEEHRTAFRGALEMRYRFLPHIYSLAHAARANLAPIVAPASYVFPADATFPPSVGDAVLMFGDSLLPSVVSTANNPDPNENVSTSVLPPGTWYHFNSTDALPGLQTITYSDLPLASVVLFVRAGAILTLQRDVIQHAAAMGGVLELHVYAGRDGAFVLTEDDGATTAYVTSPAAATRTTAFAWADATRTLSWAVTGAYSGAQTFSSAEPVLFTPNASAPLKHAPITLGSSGSISF